MCAEALILDLDADKGVKVEDGDHVVKWTNRASTFTAADFVKQDRGPPQRPGLAGPENRRQWSCSARR